jgi:DNA-binding NarL/FixJ family response regulator
VSLRILIVDDCEKIRESIKELLAASSEHWSICGEAQDALDGVDLAWLSQPDVILLDLSLPRVSGTSILEHFKRCAQRAEIVIISEQDPNVLEEIARIAQVKHWIPKSLLGSDLITKLEVIEQTKEP